MGRSIVKGILAVGLGVLVFAQTSLNNDAIAKMVKAGLGDDIVVSTINSQPANFATGANDLIALKGAGVSDKIIAAMMAKMSSSGTPAPTPAPALMATPAAPAATGSAPGPVNEVGVYFLKGETWADLAPEVVNFKTGGVLKSIGTVGIVKGDVNGEHELQNLYAVLECASRSLLPEPYRTMDRAELVRRTNEFALLTRE